MESWVSASVLFHKHLEDKNWLGWALSLWMIRCLLRQHSTAILVWKRKRGSTASQVSMLANNTLEFRLGPSREVTLFIKGTKYLS